MTGGGGSPDDSESYLYISTQSCMDNNELASYPGSSPEKRGETLEDLITCP